MMELSEQFPRRPQTNCLSTNFQYTPSPALSSQTTHPMTSFDGLPRATSDQQFLDTWATSTFSNNYSTLTSMPASQGSTQWTDPNLLTDFDNQNSNSYYDYSPTPTHHENNDTFQRSRNLAEIPRTWPTEYHSRAAYDNSMLPKTYLRSNYMMDSNEDSSQITPRLISGIGYDDAQESSHYFARLSISRSPKIEQDVIDSTAMSFDKPPSFVVQSRESSNDSGNSSWEMTVAESEDHRVEEPYAKLIHRALMSVPSHSMVLQEIYQWFRDNTIKGSSNTKGWMNSIRHNLSMNAAFKKTERKLFSNETKKSTKWVLEDFAVKDGVQSTTRYRKKTGVQKMVKSETPAPTRQSLGRKGSHSTARNLSSRQRAKTDHSVLHGALQRLETGRHPYHNSSRSRMPRGFSPITPCPEDLPSTRPFFLPKSEPLEGPSKDMCLEDVEGVYVDDGPLFSSSHDSVISLFQMSHSALPSQRY